VAGPPIYSAFERLSEVRPAVVGEQLLEQTLAAGARGEDDNVVGDNRNGFRGQCPKGFGHNGRAESSDGDENGSWLRGTGFHHGGEQCRASCVLEYGGCPRTSPQSLLIKFLDQELVGRNRGESATNVNLGLWQRIVWSQI